jgi:DNA-binding LacI/PurR family transcriptional regulator
VSHVLNGQGGRFNADTVQRVRSAAAELGYVRSAAGRALVTGHSDFIVLVIPYATFITMQDVVETVTADIEALGFAVVVHFNGAREAQVGSRRLRHMIETLRPAGLVHLGGVSDGDFDFALGAGCPVVPEAPDSLTDRRIGHLQAEHLHSRGYRRIAYAFLSDNREDPYGAARAAAVARYCAERGLAAPPRVDVPIDPEGARQALAALLAECGRPLGVACHDDKVALALVFAAQRRGLRVPADLAVVGVEGADVGQIVTPRLTSVVTDVSAGVRRIQYALGRAFGTHAPARPDFDPEKACRVLPGETT